VRAVDYRGGSSNHDIQFARADDTSGTEQFGLYAHQAGRHIVPDGKDQIDIEVIAHAGLDSPMSRRRQFIAGIFCGGGGIEPTPRPITDILVLLPHTSTRALAHRRKPYYLWAA
jgi:hypothetical protein